MILNTNLNYNLGGRNGAPEDDEDDEMYDDLNGEGGDGQYREDMEDYGQEYDAEDNGQIRGKQNGVSAKGHDSVENEKNRKLGESNVEKVVSQDGYLYFVTKDGKDKPLESHCKN